MKIKGTSGKEVKMTIFQGRMFLENSPADIVELKFQDGTLSPAIRFRNEQEEKVCMPISEETKKQVSSWYEFHTSEEALACNYNYCIE